MSVLLQVCPSAVGVGMLGLPGGPPSASSGRGGDAVALLAAVTAAGNVEFVTLHRGAVCPLMGTVSVSLGEQKCLQDQPHVHVKHVQCGAYRAPPAVLVSNTVA